VHHFAPIASLIGGALIGLAAVLLLLLNGRIAGVSGIAGSLVAGAAAGPRGWRVLFLAGLVVGAATYALSGGTVPAARTNFPPLLLVAAGLLVGWGTAQAHGCTSGHGICGLARRSLRSLVAVGAFVGSAVVTTFIARHLLAVPV
jgi:hypothetical protein